MEVLGLFHNGMNVIEYYVPHAKVHEACGKESKLTSKEHLVETMLSQEYTVEDDQRPVYEST